MIATVDVADVGARRTLQTLLRRPDFESVPGLRWANVAMAAPLGSSAPPRPGRLVLLAFWDDEDAARKFRSSDPVAERFGGGLRALLRPLRAFGTWPGLPVDVPRERNVEHEGPVVVLTMGRLRLSQTVRFLRFSRPAEKSAVADPEMIWGTASTRLPFLATISIWTSGRASATYAFGRQRPQHSVAIDEQMRKDFHHQSAFIRFAPLQLEGSLAGRNPFSADGLGV